MKRCLICGYVDSDDAFEDYAYNWDEEHNPVGTGFEKCPDCGNDDEDEIADVVVIEEVEE